MKVGQIVAPRQIEIIDIEQPNLADYPDGTVMIKTVHSAICGTDMPSFVIEHPAESYPLGPGLSIHEAVGIVTESTSDKFKAGDEGTLLLPRAVGGLSEYFLSDESVTMPLTDFPRKDCILMSQPLGTVVWACRKLPNLLNLDTVVVGQGPMGLLFTHMLSNLGAKTVITTDLVDFRLTVSKKMRATHTINAAKEDPVAAIEGDYRRQNGGSGCRSRRTPNRDNQSVSPTPKTRRHTSRFRRTGRPYLRFPFRRFLPEEP